MPKPATLPRWASDLTNNTAPTAGQMNTGWTPNQTAASAYDNYIKYWTFKWCEYIDAGAWDGNLTISGTLGVTGATTLSSTLAVTGASTLTALATLNGGASIPTAARVTLVGAAKVNHGDKYLALAPIGFFSGVGTGSPAETTAGQLSYTLDTVGGRLTIPTALRPGDRIKTVRVAWTSTAGAPTVTQKWSTYGGGYNVAMTIGTTEIEYGINVTTYTVTSPEAVALHQNPTTFTFFAYAAQLRLEAGSSTTVIYGVSAVYDSTEVPIY